jgi:hypothetical protein
MRMGGRSSLMLSQCVATWSEGSTSVP